MSGDRDWQIKNSWKIFKWIYPEAYEDIYEDKYGDIVHWCTHHPHSQKQHPAFHAFSPCNFYASMEDVESHLMPIVKRDNITIAFVLHVLQYMGHNPQSSVEWKRAIPDLIFQKDPRAYTEAFVHLKRIDL